MAFYRRYRRSFRRRAPRMRRRFRGSALRRVKKDILKCNFPTKVKFIGLPERKVMFLTNNTHVTCIKRPVVDGNEDNVLTGSTLFLYPTECENFQTLCQERNIFNFIRNDGPNINSIFANWDKYCILAVYIRIQPQANLFDGQGQNKIVPIRCYYSLNNNLVFDPQVLVNNVNAQDVVNGYNKKLMLEKPIFTFNSNEHCTFVLRAPQTMQSDTPVVHKKYQWWSVTDQAIMCLGDNKFSGAKINTNDDESIDGGEFADGSIVPLGTPIKEWRCDALPVVHCGHLYFDIGDTNVQVELNVTINYKIALKG